jgi:hypothetical protein
MTPFRATRFAAVLVPIVAVAACSSDPAPAVVQNSRMDARLAPEIAAGQIAVQPLPDGAQVAIPDDMLFAPGRTQLDDKGRLVLTHVIQALIEPTMITIGVADASDGLQGGRTQSVLDYFRDHALGQQVAPVESPPVVPVGAPGTPLQGTTITINVIPG